jgi:hypothetical protein
LYVAHSVGPYTHPSLPLANRTLLTEPDDAEEADAKGAGGAEVADQVLLPFAVVTRAAAHGSVVQGEAPRTKPCEAELKLTDPGSKCAGTGVVRASAPVAKAAPLTSRTAQAIFAARIAERRA